jgi:hypothetical protein
MILPGGKRLILSEGKVFATRGGHLKPVCDYTAFVAFCKCGGSSAGAFGSPSCSLAFCLKCEKSIPVPRRVVLA